MGEQQQDNLSCLRYLRAGVGVGELQASKAAVLQGLDISLIQHS